MLNGNFVGYPGIPHFQTHPYPRRHSGQRQNSSSTAVRGSLWQRLGPVVCRKMWKAMKLKEHDLQMVGKLGKLM